MSGLGTGLGISLASISRLAASITPIVEDAVVSDDTDNIITQGGLLLFTQDSKGIQTQPRYLQTQDGHFIVYQDDNLILLN